MSKLLLLGVCLLFIVACGKTDDIGRNNISEVTAFQEFTTMVEKNTEYNDSTGVWFLSDEGGNIGYGISSGVLVPRSDIFISLMAHPVDNVEINRTFRFQLTKRDKTNQRIELLEEEKVFIENILSSNKKYFSTHLPEEEDVFYMLSAEILGENDQVEDTLITHIYVPKQNMDAELYLDKAHYSPNDKLTLYIKNKGATILSFGTPYKLEKLEGKEWVSVPLNVGFNSVGLMLEPGQTYEQKVPLNQIKKPGKYRVLKDVSAEGTNLRETLIAQFEIRSAK